MNESNEIVREILTRALLLRVGAHAVAIVKNRVNEGIFENGSDDNASKYSTKPFSMPVGAVKPKKLMRDLLEGKDPDYTEVFKSKSGKLWVLLLNGYEWYREQNKKQTTHVDMRWTGEMMRSLKVISVNPEAGGIIIEHDGARNKQLSEWHHQGAGKSKKIRKWLYLTEKELGEIAGME